MGGGIDGSIMGIIGGGEFLNVHAWWTWWDLDVDLLEDLRWLVSRVGMLLMGRVPSPSRNLGEHAVNEYDEVGCRSMIGVDGRDDDNDDDDDDEGRPYPVDQIAFSRTRRNGATSFINSPTK